jgi:hypothetical protein
MKLKKNKENKKKQSKNLLNKQVEWNNDLDNLFDIAHANALNLMNIEEDKQFLILQRQRGRKGKMAGVDKALTRIEAIASNKQKMAERKRKRETANFNITEIPTGSSNSSEEGSKSEEEMVVDPSKPSTSRQTCTKRTKK